MDKPEIAYLGPEGTFTDLVASNRYPGAERIPCKTVSEVFSRVQQDPALLGIVPIENSSGGIIYETIDRLIDRAHPLVIREQLGVKVQLALLKKDCSLPTERIYSHFVPYHHCADWLEAHYAEAEKVVVTSTAEAARMAEKDAYAAAIGNRMAAGLYGLEVQHYPIEQDLVNETQFITIQQETNPLPVEAADTGRSRISYIIELEDRPGALYEFLAPISEHGINMSRIISRRARSWQTSTPAISVDTAPQPARRMSQSTKRFKCTRRWSIAAA